MNRRGACTFDPEPEPGSSFLFLRLLIFLTSSVSGAAFGVFSRREGSTCIEVAENPEHLHELPTHLCIGVGCQPRRLATFVMWPRHQPAGRPTFVEAIYNTYRKECKRRNQCLSCSDTACCKVCRGPTPTVLLCTRGSIAQAASGVRTSRCISTETPLALRCLISH